MKTWIGGIVIEVGQPVDGRQRIVTVERLHGRRGLDISNATGIWVEEHRYRIEVGDKLFSQGRYAYWTSVRLAISPIVRLNTIGRSFAVEVAATVVT